MPSEYETAHAKYRELAKKAAEGNAEAKRDKAKVMNEIRAIERDAAKAGTILSAQYKADKVVVQTRKTHSKRSLQEEYVRKFDPEMTVNIGGKEQTLQEYHTDRLLK